MRTRFAEEIAIIGVSCRLPGAPGRSRFWRVLETGQCTVGRVPDARFPTDRYRHPNRLAPGKSVSFAAGIVDDAHDF
jgi:phthiocerol/phenolphthiocerol synthesis type-I polyketide synthase C